jgi:hypothetical protein
MGSDHDRDEDEEAELAAAEDEVSGHPLPARQMQPALEPDSQLANQLASPAATSYVHSSPLHSYAWVPADIYFFPGLPTTHAPAPFRPFVSHLTAVCIALQQAMEDEEDGMGLHGEDEEGDEEVRCCCS